MIPKIFISYREKTSANFVDKVYATFTSEYGRIHVFRFTTNNKSGPDFELQLLQAIFESNVFVVVICKDWIQEFIDRVSEKDFVLLELKQALNDPNKLIVAIVEDKSHVPDMAALNTAIQAEIKAQPGKAAELNELKALIAKLLRKHIKILPLTSIGSGAFDPECVKIFHEIELWLKAKQAGTIAQTDFPEAEMTEHYTRAEDVLAVGIDLLGTLEMQRGNMEKALGDSKSEKTFRLLFVDPESSACKIIFRRGGQGNGEHGSVDNLRASIRVGLDIAWQIKRRAPTADRFMVGLTDFPLGFGAIGFDLDDPAAGAVYAWHYCYKPDNKSNRPVLVVRASEDPELFECYRDQLIKMWRDGTILDSPGSPKRPGILAWLFG